MAVSTCRVLVAVHIASALLPALPARAEAGPLEILLRAFAERWDEMAMQELPGIGWNGISYPADSEQDNAYTYVLRGELRLRGFATVEVPVGVGAAQTTRKLDEGDASFEIRFSNSNDPALRGPYFILMSKPYPSADYAVILRRQMMHGQIVLLADDCTRDALGRPAEQEHAAYYRIDLPDAPTAVFVRAGRMDGGTSGPGETTFAFSLFTPGTDLTNSGCILRQGTP